MQFILQILHLFSKYALRIYSVQECQTLTQTRE